LRATPARLEAYLYALSVHLERISGQDLGPAALVHVRDGRVVFELLATVAGATFRLAEMWDPIGGGYQRIEYRYDLIDTLNGRRRAFHRHHVRQFRVIAEVEVHEHCEEILGRPTCRHHHGRPIRDGHEAIRLLFLAWTEPGPLGCDELDCIDAA
jgi:hypothetical protein